MGREMKRVPMDFDWPLKERWSGYINPYYAQSKTCTACSGTGYSRHGRQFKDEWYGFHGEFDPIAYGVPPLAADHPAIVARAERNEPDRLRRPAERLRLWSRWSRAWNHNLNQADVDALIAEGRLSDFTMVPRTEEQQEALRKQVEAGGSRYYLHDGNGYTPTAEEVNAWSMACLGHDAINAWICIKARCAREGVPHECEVCHGKVTQWPSPEIERLCDEWTREEPPAGDGYQLWETTSEGSPVSPVFASLDELCEWCADNATTFGSARASADEWRRMLDDGFVCHREGNMVFV